MDDNRIVGLLKEIRNAVNVIAFILAGILGSMYFYFDK